MNITQYIKAKDELNALHYGTVYKTITTLLGDGIISMDDFQKTDKVKNQYVR